MSSVINVIVDCEASGPCPTAGDLIEFAAITEDGRDFQSGKLKPQNELYDRGAYNSLGIDRTIHESYTGLYVNEFEDFDRWLNGLGGKPVFWSDNPAFDWQWINDGFCYWLAKKNPFGFSARRIGDLYAGANGNLRDSTGWKKWRVTKHTHDPLDDARGNLEAFLEIRKRYRL
jgi:hypothetical protein